MSDTDIYQTLTQIDFFRDFSREDVNELLNVAQWVKYESGHAIITEGKEGHDMYVLVRGNAKVVKNGKTLAALSPGDCFGEISALAKTPRSAHIIARGPCFCVRFESIQLHRLPTELQLKIFKKLLFTLAFRLTALNRKFSVT